MKVLYIDCEYYYYPNGVDTFESLGEYINNHYNEFVLMTKLSDENTVPPYFIDEYKNQVYVNLSECSTIEEVEATVMTKSDYSTSLNNAIDEVCYACDSFDSSNRTCECGDFKNNICLNGNCDMFSLAEDE